MACDILQSGGCQTVNNVVKSGRLMGDEGLRIDRKKLKRDTRDAIHDGKTSIIWIGLVFILISLLLQVLSLSVSGELAVLTELYRSQTLNVDAVAQDSPFAGILVAAIDVMSILLGVGFTLACLTTARRQGAAMGNLFDGFARFLRALTVSLLRYLLLSLWSMLYVMPAAYLTVLGGTWSTLAPLVCLPLLLPAARAYYGYRQALYIMLDEPALSAIDCLRMSRRVMEGHRGELFLLDLSFIGWTLLCVIPPVIVWVLPYMQVCFAGYYDALTLPYRTQRDAAPPEAPEAPENGPENEE